MALNQGGAMDPRQVVKALRIIWAAVLFSLIMYVLVFTIIQNPSAAPADRAVQYSIALCGIVTGAVVLYLRFVRIAALISPSEPIDEKTLAFQARFNYILCYVFSEATSLLGFALAFMHGDPKLYVPLYLGGVLLMLLCFPRLPATE